jgi:hypothetical protein
VPEKETEVDMFDGDDVATGDEPEDEDYPDDELTAIQAARKESGLPADAEAS